MALLTLPANRCGSQAKDVEEADQQFARSAGYDGWANGGAIDAFRLPGSADGLLANQTAP